MILQIGEKIYRQNYFKLCSNFSFFILSFKHHEDDIFAKKVITIAAVWSFGKIMENKSDDIIDYLELDTHQISPDTFTETCLIWF